MGGMWGGWEVVNDVGGGEDREWGVEKDGRVEDGLIIGFVVLFMGMGDIDKVFREFGLFKEVLELLDIEVVL